MCCFCQCACEGGVCGGVCLCVGACVCERRRGECVKERKRGRTLIRLKNNYATSRHWRVMVGCKYLWSQPLKYIRTYIYSYSMYTYKYVLGAVITKIL
jgi:hypothetical protein